MLTHHKTTVSFVKYLMSCIFTLMATASNANNINNHNPNSNAGQLSPLNPATVYAGPPNLEAISITPNGKFAYMVSYWASGLIAQYSVGTDGQLNKLNPFTVSAGNNSFSLTITPDGKFAYAVNIDSNNISQYSVGTDGQLHPLTPYTVPAGYTPISTIVITPDGRFAYLVTNSGHIDEIVLQYSVGANGQLTPLNPASVPAPGESVLAMTSDGKFVYASGAKTIFQYSVAANGQLIPLNPGVVPTSCNHSVGSWAITPDNRFAYTLCGDAPSGYVLQFSIDVNGQLNPLNPASVDGVNGPMKIVVTPNGKFAYVVNTFFTGNISQFSIGTDGQLSLLDPATVSVGRLPYPGMAITPDGQFAYQTDGSSNIYQFRIKVSR
jgi:6-phosphogluconolactonase (cycloisomerase 2 family)